MCVSDPAAQGFQCTDPEENAYFVPYGASQNYVALSPDNLKILVEACMEEPESGAPPPGRARELAKQKH